MEYFLKLVSQGDCPRVKRLVRAWWHKNKTWNTSIEAFHVLIIGLYAALVGFSFWSYYQSTPPLEPATPSPSPPYS